MDLINQSNTILMLKRLLDRASPVKTCVAYSPGKPKLGEDKSQYFDRAAPEETGVPLRVIERLLTELSIDRATDLHTCAAAR